MFVAAPVAFQGKAVEQAASTRTELALRPGAAVTLGEGVAEAVAEGVTSAAGEPLGDAVPGGVTEAEPETVGTGVKVRVGVAGGEALAAEVWLGWRTAAL